MQKKQEIVSLETKTFKDKIMINRESPDGKKDQSEKNNDESFENLIRKKLDAEQKLEKKYRKVVTLLKSDIKGSTDFQLHHGDIEAAARLNIHTKMLKTILSKHGGRILNEMTDGADAFFENSPENAVKTAIEFMQQVQKYNENNHPKLNIRIAMNHGPVVAISEKHYDGLTISTTARVEQAMKDLEKKDDELAKTDLIFISGSLYEEIRNSEDIICRWVDQVEAKGLDKPLDLYRVVWNLKQEQILFESSISSRETRGLDDGKLKRPVTIPKKRSIFVVEIAKEADKVKLSGYEQAELEQKTIRQYEEIEVNFEKIEEYVKNIISLLNQATHQGSISKEILKTLKATGKYLYDELFNETIKDKFATTSSEDLIFSIDDHLGHIPWELLYDGASFLSLRFNMGRVVSTRQKISEGAYRPMSFPLKMLVLSDPRNNLNTAHNEGHNIMEKLVSLSSPINVYLKTGNINTTYVMEKICNFDIVHYAGHSDYDSANPAKSGWLLYDKKLVAEEIKKMGELRPMPALVFSNACHSGQTDKWEISEDYENKIYGMANAFLLTGVHHYIGTFWEILDEPGSLFAMAFYEQLSNGKPIGEALRLARMELIKKYGEETIIWASYMLYGDPSFYYIHPMAQDEIIQTKTEDEERPIHTPAGDSIRSGEDVVTLTKGGTNKNNLIYWSGGIAAIIFIVLSFLFFRQTKQTEGPVESVRQTKTEPATQQAGKDLEQLALEKARQLEITASEQKEKEKRIDTLVAELANRFREGTITTGKNPPIDEWVSRPLVISLFPLKFIGKNNEIGRDMVPDQLAEFFGTSKRVKLVERELIDKLLEELKLSSSDLADNQTALRIGKLVGARFITSGSVFQIKEEVRLSIKLVETETTSIIITKSQTGKGPDSIPALAKTISRECIDALTSKFPLRARIVGFVDGGVVINIGKNHGMVKGTKLNVYLEKKVEGSNATINTKAGTIEAKDVEENVSTGTVLSKTVELEKNMKVGEIL